jgi:hypothetical protein
MMLKSVMMICFSSASNTATTSLCLISISLALDLQASFLVP